ncbi:MAG: hypothetical protein QNK30_14625 [Bacteroidales bacterium]|nr:hypothetical protein [Bacteroidales bacterium]
MSTNLENYLHKKRNLLDVEKPDDEIIWEGIRNDLQSQKFIHRPEKRKKLIVKFRNIAAIILLIFSLSYVVYDIAEKHFTKRITLAEIDNSLGQQEKEYITLIKLKESEVQSSSLSENIVIMELFEEIQRLDTIYDQVMDDLNEIGYNEKIINTIFDTYEKKIQILELIILETNKPESHENNINNYL